MKRKKKDALTKAIEARERIIKRHRDEIHRLRAVCDEKCKAIERRVSVAQVLLDALRSGALKP